MLLGDYASDSGSDSESVPGLSIKKPPAPGPSAPTATSAAATSSAPKAKKRGGPVRITLDLPKTSGDDEEGSKGINGGSENGDGDEDDGPVLKKAKVSNGGGGIKGGKGSSSLLGMLPPPKRRIPASGTGKGKIGLPTISKSTLPKSTAPLKDTDEDEDDGPIPPTSGLLLPSSIARGKAKAEASAKASSAVDIFGLSSSSSSTPLPKITPTPSAPMEITSAPSAPDFVPPPPTVDDPYPGYYQLPSGSWAAYDPEYYSSFFASSSGVNEGMAQPKTGEDGRVGRHWEAFEGREGDVLDIDASEGLAEARAEEERKKSVIKPRTLGDGFEYQAIGQVKGLASDRHQLTSLLNTAYTQRDALEERLSENKKSMRAARAKYGF